MALHSETEPVGLRPYVLDLSPNGADLGGEEMVLGILVMKRPSPQPGLLFALPSNSVQPSLLETAQTGALEDLLGPSMTVELAGALLNPDNVTLDPMAVPDHRVDVLMVDFSQEIVPHLWELNSLEELKDANTFSIQEPDMIPLPEDLIAAAVGWTLGQDLSKRVQFYSAGEEEVELIPAEGTSSKRKSQATTSAADKSAGPSEKPKRPTVAKLAESLEQITAVLPTLTAQIQELSERTSSIEAAQVNPGRPSALRKPLAQLATSGLSSTRPLSSFLHDMPPPRSTSTPLKSQPKGTAALLEAEAKEAEKDLLSMEPSSDLARAVLEQSKALTTLVGQIASSSSDPLGELASSTGGISSKGALGRAKLQQELASQKGLFFTSVLQQMSRRMSPTSSADASPGELHAKEICATRYLERFGGFGRHRELGFIIWQLAMALDFLQQDNTLAAKDIMALLFVFLEQMVLDNGKMDVAVLLALIEDPPQGLFSNRSFTAIARQRAFAATADQKWVTVALQYLKELDTIQTRRAEVTKDKPIPPPSNDPMAKKKAKGRGKAKKSIEEDQE